MRPGTVAQEDTLPVEHVRWKIERVELLGDIPAGVELEQVNDAAVHEVGVDARGRLLPLGITNGGTVDNVRSHVVYHTLIDSDGFLLAGHVLQLLVLDTNETDTGVPAHEDHALEVPIGTGIGSESTEIVILGVVVGHVARVEDDVGADGTGDTIAESADLYQICQRYDHSVRHVKFIPGQGK